jgi:hypothetical protein
MKKAEVYLEYQPYIESTPHSNTQAYQQSTSADSVTINHWAEIWLSQIRQNKEYFGSFAKLGVGQLYNSKRYQPCIIAGSGPSLKNSIDGLKNRGDIALVSCLHNFHFMLDNDIKVDYFVTLDAGHLPIEEVSEGGQKTPEEYWELTKDQTLIAFIGTHPDLLKKWQGKIYFFNAPVPDAKHMEKVDEIEPFRTYVSSGGNVMGSCLYVAKAILGCETVAFTGADLSFGYERKFHSWDSKYDKDMGITVPMVDIYGVPVKSWMSYKNFKTWFDYISQTCPGRYFNCSEGGCLGSYREGNIRSIIQMDLKAFIAQFHANESLRETMENPQTDLKRVLF